MKIILIALTFVSFLPLQATDEAIFSDVQGADDARVAAMIAANASELEELLSDELHYAHSSGLVENKTEHIATLTSGRLVYQQVDHVGGAR